jgi:hypothetical protein
LPYTYMLAWFRGHKLHNSSCQYHNQSISPSHHMYLAIQYNTSQLHDQILWDQAEGRLFSWKYIVRH